MLSNDSSGVLRRAAHARLRRLSVRAPPRVELADEATRRQQRRRRQRQRFRTASVAREPQRRRVFPEQAPAQPAQGPTRQTAQCAASQSWGGCSSRPGHHSTPVLLGTPREGRCSHHLQCTQRRADRQGRNGSSGTYAAMNVKVLAAACKSALTQRSIDATSEMQHATMQRCNLQHSRPRDARQGDRARAA